MKLTNEGRAALRKELTGRGASGVSVLRNADLIALAQKMGVDPAPYCTGAADPAPAPALRLESEAPAPDATDAHDVTQGASLALRDVMRRVDAGDFTSARDVLADLIRQARKPAERIEVQVPVPVPAGPAGSRPIHVPRVVGKDTAAARFGLPGDKRLSGMGVTLWDAPDAPAVDPHYLYQGDALHSALVALRRGKPVFLTGPKGTGKTEFAKQIAARTGRPFVRIQFDAGTEAVELFGLNAPCKAEDGGVMWIDGQLTAALRRPGTVILFDEPSVARPGVLMALQSVLDSRELHIKDTGEVVKAADGVCMLVADNTNGTGDGTGQYADTNILNAAFCDRFEVFLEFDYLSSDLEARILVNKTGCAPLLADLLVAYASAARQKAHKGEMTAPVGLRRLIALAGQITDGVAPDFAVRGAILAPATPGDREVLRQLAAVILTSGAIAEAMKGRATPTPSASPAARDFAD